MRDPAWINVTPGVPIVADFGSTRGQGTPICISAATNIAYYLAAGDIVTPLAGGAGDGNWIPLVDGAEPPGFITDGGGVLILVAGP
mgnify:CR=1 FL=1